MAIIVDVLNVLNAINVISVISVLTILFDKKCLTRVVDASIMRKPSMRKPCVGKSWKGANNSSLFEEESDNAVNQTLPNKNQHTKGAL